MPLIIPPTEKKLFNEQAEVLAPVWNAAEESLRAATRLVVAGYSFPEADGHAFSLLDEFVGSDAAHKKIEIVDPYPDGVFERIRTHIQDRCEIEVHTGSLASYLGEPEEVSDTEEQFPEEELFDALLGSSEESRGRSRYILRALGHCNLHRQKFDLTTFDGRRFLDASVEGEFAQHLHCAYRPEVFQHRIENIRIRTGEGESDNLALSDIWIIHPLKQDPITEADLEAVDIAELAVEMKEMIRNGYHCVDDRETEYFCRRFLAS